MDTILPDQGTDKKEIASGNRVTRTWHSVIVWITRVLMPLSIVLAFAGAFYLYLAARREHDADEALAMAVIAGIIASFILYWLLYLLRHIILAALIVYLIWFCFKIPGYLDNKHTTTGQRTEFNINNFCFTCQEDRNTIDSLRSQVHTLDSTMKVLYNRCDTGIHKDSSEKFKNH